MSTVSRMSDEDKKNYQAKIEAMNDGDLQAEIHRVHVDLAHVRQTLAELAVTPEPEPAAVGPVGFSDAGAVAEFLEEHRVPVIRDERQRVAWVMEKNMQTCSSIAVSEQQNRARRQAYRERARIIRDGAEPLRAAAAIIQNQIDVSRHGMITPLEITLPRKILGLVQAAEDYFLREGGN